MPENGNKTEELLQKGFDLYDSGDYLGALIYALKGEYLKWLDTYRRAEL